MTIADGKLIAEKITGRLKSEVAGMVLKPHLAVVLVGADRPSQTYVRKKREAAERIGIRFSEFRFPASIKTDDLVGELKSIQKADLSGIIVQLPLPKGIDKTKVLNALDPEIDVDYLSWESLGKLVIGENPIVPPTPGAILEILKYYRIGLAGKHVVLVGQGDLIGKPLANILVQMPVTLTVCGRNTKNLKSHTRQADILITGVGKYDLIRGDMIRPRAVVIDAGVSFKGGKMFGDINFREVSKKAALATPTPGGVGPVTVAKLLENVVRTHQRLQGKK
ncbi:MAG: bifunctional 5,10-methylenetetrahydrofolate dehydrogenase/5,10-methenyltetrahydrofolate cyclohydrolase [Candidatus Saccharibacteria bacterium]